MAEACSIEQPLGSGDGSSVIRTMSLQGTTKITSVSLCCNMVLSITGSAVLGVGAQMKTLGWVLAPAMLLLGAGLTTEMVWLTAVTSERLERNGGSEVVSYQDFAEGALGRPGLWASAITSTLSMVGMIIGGLILEAQNMETVLPIGWSWPGDHPEDAGRKWWALLLSATTLFYCLVDIGKLLEKAGIIGVVLTVVCMVLVYTGAFTQVPNIPDFNEACRDGIQEPYHSLGINSGHGEGFQGFMNFFSVTSYIIFIFAIVVTLPTLRSTMAVKEDVTKMSGIAFFVVAAEFLVIMLVSYWVFGNLGPQNIVDGMRTDRDSVDPGWWALPQPWAVGTLTLPGKALGIILTFHLLCSDAIYVPCTVVAIEALLPRRLAVRKRVWYPLRFGVTLLRLVVTLAVKDFVKASNLTSAAFLICNNVMLPVLAFYKAGPSEGVGFVRKAIHGLVLIFGVFCMVFGTISAVQDLWPAPAGPPGQLLRPGITQQCRDAYCALHPGLAACKPHVIEL